MLDEKYLTCRQRYFEFLFKSLLLTIFIDCFYYFFLLRGTKDETDQTLGLKCVLKKQKTQQWSVCAELRSMRCGGGQRWLGWTMYGGRLCFWLSELPQIGTRPIVLVLVPTDGCSDCLVFAMDGRERGARVWLQLWDAVWIALRRCAVTQPAVWWAFALQKGQVSQLVINCIASDSF